MNAEVSETDLSELNTLSESAELNMQVIPTKINLASEREWIKQTEFKSQTQRHSSSNTALSVVKWPHYKKQVKENELYCIKNYSHFW